jgi:hypothetical protein
VLDSRQSNAVQKIKMKVRCAGGAGGAARRHGKRYLIYLLSGSVGLSAGVRRREQGDLSLGL